MSRRLYHLMLIFAIFNQIQHDSFRGKRRIRYSNVAIYYEQPSIKVDIHTVRISIDS